MSANTEKPETTDSYYTPQIEEFHDGFEYESVNMLDGSWDKEIFDLNHAIGNYDRWAENLEHHISSKTVRVKFLSHSDFINEGWEETPDPAEPDFTFFKNGSNTLSFEKENPALIKITNIFVQTIFWGHIKNVSEFRKVLEMVGIKK